MDTQEKERVAIEGLGEAPPAQLPVVLSTFGQMLPIEKLPPFMQGNTRDDIDAIIEDLINGEAVPRGFLDKNGAPQPGKMRIAIMNGRRLGYDAFFSIQHQMVVNGLPSWYGDVPLARAYLSGLMADFEERIDGLDDVDEQGNPKNPTAYCRIVRRGLPTPIIRTFSWKQAVAAELTNKTGPWQGYYERMLQFRARTFGLRDALPEVLLGMRIAEEYFNQRHWAQTADRPVSQIIDVQADQPQQRGPAPPRPSKKTETAKPSQTKEEVKKEEVPAEPPKEYPFIDQFGNALTTFASGDWIDNGLEAMERLDPQACENWLEHNGAVILELKTVLGEDQVAPFAQKLAELTAAREAAEAAKRTSETERARSGATRAQRAGTQEEGGNGVSHTPSPPPAAPVQESAKPDGPAKEIVFEVKGGNGTLLAETADYAKATALLLKLAETRSLKENEALYRWNKDWLEDAHRAGAVSKKLRDLIFPLPAEETPREQAPISNTPPPAAKPAAKPKEEGKAKPKAKAAPEDIDSKWGLKPVPFHKDSETAGTDYFQAFMREVNRLVAEKAPKAVFERFRELIEGSFAEYTAGNATWARMLAANLDKAKAKAPS